MAETTKTSTQTDAEKAHEQAAAARQSINDAEQAAAEKQAEKDVKAIEEREDSQPKGVESDTDRMLDSAGTVGTLQEWEHSPVGQAWIKASKGAKAQTEDPDKK